MLKLYKRPTPTIIAPHYAMAEIRRDLLCKHHDEIPRGFLPFLFWVFSLHNRVTSLAGTAVAFNCIFTNEFINNYYNKLPTRKMTFSSNLNTKTMTEDIISIMLWCYSV